MLLQVLQPIFDPTFSEHSYGFLFRCAKITEVGGWRVHGWVGAVRESSVNNLKRYQ
jgi:hypothetical protein